MYTFNSFDATSLHNEAEDNVLLHGLYVITNGNNTVYFNDIENI